MKIITLFCLLTGLLICKDLLSQNGVFVSSRFEFINKMDQTKNRVDFTKNILTFFINETNGVFSGGKVLWEIQANHDSEIIEISLKKKKKIYYDKDNHATTRVYDADILMLDQIIGEEEIRITKFERTQTYRLEMYNVSRETINRFDNLKKLQL